ncbi:MAG: translation initiation factor IF-2 N-terminal domain-containing protein, partial [Syntrophomonas sp.]|nr:translation initiation factor IF-2 N-terminal domain-containing protein [Syntrophomonas sp.]
MAKIRVHELAKELGIPSKEMVDTLQNLGLDLKNHMSTMEESQASWVRKRLGEKNQPAPQIVQPVVRDEHPGAEPRKGSATSSPRAQQNKGINRAVQPRPGINSPSGPVGKDQEKASGSRTTGLQPNPSGIQEIQPPEFERRGNEFRNNQPRPMSGSDYRQGDVRPGAGPRPANGPDNRQSAPR